MGKKRNYLIEEKKLKDLRIIAAKHESNFPRKMANTSQNIYVIKTKGYPLAQEAWRSLGP